MTRNEIELGQIEDSQLKAVLDRVGVGLEQYSKIQESLYKCDVSTTREFQKKYNYFYRVRRNAEWQRSYFNLLESAKTNNITFDEALSQLFESTGRLEASFTSKLVATINPNLPVVDKFVLQNLRLKLPSYSVKDRQKRIVKLYGQLTQCLNTISETESGQKIILRFQQIYPEYKISSTKIIDLFLWQCR